MLQPLLLLVLCVASKLRLMYSTNILWIGRSVTPIACVSAFIQPLFAPSLPYRLDKCANKVSTSNLLPFVNCFCVLFCLIVSGNICLNQPFSLFSFCLKYLSNGCCFYFPLTQFLQDLNAIVNCSNWEHGDGNVVTVVEAVEVASADLLFVLDDDDLCFPYPTMGTCLIWLKLNLDEILPITDLLSLIHISEPTRPY